MHFSLTGLGFLNLCGRILRFKENNKSPFNFQSFAVCEGECMKTGCFYFVKTPCIFTFTLVHFLLLFEDKKLTRSLISTFKDCSTWFGKFEFWYVFVVVVYISVQCQFQVPNISFLDYCYSYDLTLLNLYYHQICTEIC